jgi:hypothetical protein
LKKKKNKKNLAWRTEIKFTKAYCDHINPKKNKHIFFSNL